MKLSSRSRRASQAALHRRGGACRFTARTRGFTLVELTVASSIALFVVAGVIGIMLQVGIEQRLSATDAFLEQRAGQLQDQLTATLRSMSAREGTVFAEPVTGGGGATIGFGRIIVARGIAPDFPREELGWNQSAGVVTHRPDRSQSGERILFQPAPSVVLRNLVFSPSIKTDGAPDPSLINVWMELDDDSWAGRQTAAGAAADTVVQRFFSVKMRNH
jgi:hypothetical protein